LADRKKRFETMVQRFKEHGFKMTPQRRAILDILAQSEDHPSVEAIHAQLKEDFPTMSLATVYKNVSLMKSLGEVLEIGVPDGSNRYDGNKPDPHPHVMCIRCQKIVDPDLANLEEMKNEVASETDFTILNHRLDFFGLCRECRQTKD
jgi:Fur family peroxide stress response transcriptional regulator